MARTELKTVLVSDCLILLILVYHSAQIEQYRYNASVHCRKQGRHRAESRVGYRSGSRSDL